MRSEPSAKKMSLLLVFQNFRISNFVWSLKKNFRFCSFRNLEKKTPTGTFSQPMAHIEIDTPGQQSHIALYFI